MRLLMEDLRCPDTVTRIKSLHPTDYRKRLVNRMKCVFKENLVYILFSSYIVVMEILMEDPRGRA